MIKKLKKINKEFLLRFMTYFMILMFSPSCSLSPNSKSQDILNLIQTQLFQNSSITTKMKCAKEDCFGTAGRNYVNLFKSHGLTLSTGSLVLNVMLLLM